MKTFFKNFFILTSLVILLAQVYSCSPATPKLAPEQKFKEAEKVKAENKNVFRRPSVDILFIVDDSGSMSSHQNNLSNNIALFVDEFSKLKLIDYHIGVISTSSTDKGLLRGSTRYVDNKTPNGLQILKKDLILGTGGDSTEMVFTPLMTALNPANLSGFNQGFYRKDAYIIPIFITDAEDQSYGTTPQAAMDFLVQLKGDKKKILSFGAIVPVGVSNNDCQRDEYVEPEKIEKFLGLNINAGKNIVSLCDPEYGLKLVDFSKSIISAVNKPIVLDRKPSLSSIKVFFGTQEIPSDFKTGWYFDPRENSIMFGEELALDESQPDDAKIEVIFDAGDISQVN